MSWLKNVFPPKIKKIVGSVKKSVPDGVWHKCLSCKTALYNSDLEKNLYVCPKCDHHHRLPARERLKLLFDSIGQKEIFQNILPKDPLKFVDSKPYHEKLTEAQAHHKIGEALVVITGKIESLKVTAAAFEFTSRCGPWFHVGIRYRSNEIAIEYLHLRQAPARRCIYVGCLDHPATVHQFHCWGRTKRTLAYWAKNGTHGHETQVRSAVSVDQRLCVSHRWKMRQPLGVS